VSSASRWCRSPRPLPGTAGATRRRWTHCALVTLPEPRSRNDSRCLRAADVLAVRLLVLSERVGAGRVSSALVYVSRITPRRSGISSRSGCVNRRRSRILRKVSTNRLRSARRAEARTNNSCKAFRDGVDGDSTMQRVAARRKTSAARLLVCAPAVKSPSQMTAVAVDRDLRRVRNKICPSRRTF
jgi:hypothetical protein